VQQVEKPWRSAWHNLNRPCVAHQQLKVENYPDAPSVEQGSTGYSANCGKPGKCPGTFRALAFVFRDE
jgi:hypothetical protein